MKKVLIRIILILIVSAVAILSACHKAQIACTVPPPPAPAAPIASLTAIPQ
jgi:hypothetical protein